MKKRAKMLILLAIVITSAVISSCSSDSGSIVGPVKNNLHVTTESADSVGIDVPIPNYPKEKWECVFDPVCTIELTFNKSEKGDVISASSFVKIQLSDSSLICKYNLDFIDNTNGGWNGNMSFKVDGNRLYIAYPAPDAPDSRGFDIIKLTDKTMKLVYFDISGTGRQYLFTKTE